MRLTRFLLSLSQPCAEEDEHIARKQAHKPKNYEENMAARWRDPDGRIFLTGCRGQRPEQSRKHHSTLQSSKGMLFLNPLPLALLFSSPI